VPKVYVHTEIYYKIPKGTLVWVNMGQGLEIGMVSEVTVVYTANEMLSVTAQKYRFKLPPNDRNAVSLEVYKEKVTSEERVIPPEYS